MIPLLKLLTRLKIGPRTYGVSVVMDQRDGVPVQILLVRESLESGFEPKYGKGSWSAGSAREVLGEQSCSTLSGKNTTGGILGKASLIAARLWDNVKQMGNSTGVGIPTTLSFLVVSFPLKKLLEGCR